MNIKQFYKNHKKAVIFGGAAIAVVGGIVIFKRINAKTVAKIACETAKKGNSLKPIVLHPTEKLKMLGFDGIDDYGGVFESMTDYGLKVKDLGNLGEAMMELEQVGPDNECFILFNVVKNAGAKVADATGSLLNTGNPEDVVTVVKSVAQ